MLKVKSALESSETAQVGDNALIVVCGSKDNGQVRLEKRRLGDGKQRDSIE